jgi:hypothetical protein
VIDAIAMPAFFVACRMARVAGRESFFGAIANQSHACVSSKIT